MSSEVSVFKEQKIKLARQIVASTASEIAVNILSRAGIRSVVTPALVTDTTRKAILMAERIHQELSLFIETGEVSEDE